MSDNIKALIALSFLVLCVGISGFGWGTMWERSQAKPIYQSYVTISNCDIYPTKNGFKLFPKTHNWKFMNDTFHYEFLVIGDTIRVDSTLENKTNE